MFKQLRVHYEMRRTDKIVYKSFITTFKKKGLRHFFKRYSNANGQVLIEYILLTILILAVAGAFMKAFSQANYNYLERVFGGRENDYLGCLLRKGQLPQLGSEVKAVGACPTPSFEFEANVPSYPAPNIPPAPILSDSIIPPGPIVPPPNPIITPGVPPSSKIPPSGSDETLSKGGGSSGIRTGSKDIIPIKGGDIGANGDLGSGQLSSNATSKGKARIPISQSEKNRLNKSSVEGSSNNISDNIQGPRLVELSEDAKDKLASQAKTAISGQGTGSSSRKKVILLAENKKSTPIQNEDLDWNFASFFKHLIIIAIIVIVLLLIGGQFLQIKKGLEGSR